MATVDIRLDGVSIAADVLYQQTQFGALANGQPGQAELVVKNDQGQYGPGDFVMGMTLELYIDGQREWDGWLFDFRRTWPFEVMDTTDPMSVPKYWKLRGFDRNILFQKRFLYDQNDPDNPYGLPIYPGTTTDQTALLDICANYVHLTGLGLSTSGITEVASPGQGGEFSLGYVGAPWGTAFDDCAKMSGAIFYIDPDRVIHYRGDTNANAPFDLSDTPWQDAGSIGYADMVWTKDFTDAATEAMVWGAGYGSRWPVFAHYEGDIATYGRWQWGDIFTGAYKQATVNKRARTYVDGSPSNHRGHGKPIPTVTFTLYEPGLRCGMVAQVLNRVFGFNRNLPVTKLDISFPSPTAPRFDYEMTLKVDEPFSAPDLWQTQNWHRQNDPPEPETPETSEEETQAASGLVAIDEYERGTVTVDAYYVAAETYGPSYDGLSISDFGGAFKDSPVITRYLPDGSKTSWLVNTVGWGETEKVTADELGCYVMWQGGLGAYEGGDPDTDNFLYNGLRAYDINGNLRWEWLVPEYGVVHFSLGAGDGYVWVGDRLALFTNTGTEVFDHGVTLGGKYWYYTTLGPSANTMWAVSNDWYVSVVGAAGIVGGPWAIPTAVQTDIGAIGFLMWVKDSTRFYMWGNNEVSETSVYLFEGDGSALPESRQVVSLPADTEIVALDPVNETIFAAGPLWARGYEWRADHQIQVLKWSTTTTVTPTNKSWDSQPLAAGGKFQIFGEIGSTPGMVVLDMETGDVLEGPYTWGGDSTDGYSVNGGAMGFTMTGDPLPDLKTPPLDPWLGGNDYLATSSYNSPPADIEIVEGAAHRTDSAPLLNFKLHDNEYALYPVDYIPGIDVGDLLYDFGENYRAYPQPVSGWSTRYWADKEGNAADLGDDLDILIKWRYTGATPPANAYLRFYWEGYSIPESLDKADVWVQMLFMGFGPGNYYIQSWLNTLTTDTHDPTYRGGEGWHWPYHAYYLSANNPLASMLEDEWYWTRLKVGALDGWGYPYVKPGDGSDKEQCNLNLSAMKTWPASEEEPEVGTAGPYNWYWNQPSYLPAFPPEEPVDEIVDYSDGGWDIELPAAWYKNWETHVPDGDQNKDSGANQFYLRAFNEGSGKFEVDGIYRYGATTAVVPSTTSHDVAEVPLFVESQDDRSVYETRYPYKPGTLMIYLSGSLQGAGEFVETDPPTGLFAIFDVNDRSGDMYVTYERTSTDALHEDSAFYRPAKVLQYGWGTALDGYNCNMAAACMALDRHTLGAKTSTPPLMRSYQYDQSGGTDLGDIAVAWSNGYSETFEHGIYSWAQFLSYVRGGRGCVLQGLYGNLPSYKRFSDTFTGGHSIYINEELTTGHFLGYDPLTSANVVYTEAELQAYAEGLSWVSADQVSAGFTQVTS